MTKYETWEIVNQCKGLNFSWKGKDKDNSHIFSFKNKNKLFTLVIKSYWKILHYNETSYESDEYNKQADYSLLMNHAAGDFRVTEVSIGENFELKFFMKGKLELVIPTHKRSKGAFYEHIPPEWVFMEADEVVTQSPLIK